MSEPTDDAALALIAAIADELTPGRRDKDLVIAARELRKAAGVAPKPVYDVDKIAEFLNSPTHAPMNTHNPRNGECMDCPWPVYALPATDLARELVAYLEGKES